MRKWAVIVALASAQFVMVLDSTVMNVSIDEVIRDLDTSVSSMQLAISAYTLTMAALVMTFGKVGDIIGRKRAFRVGLALFGLGAGITAASDGIAMLMIGWSFTEAIGAALMIPATAALVAGNYTGRDRAIAYGIIGGIAGAAAACGPIVGGWVSTSFSWRVVFAAEVVLVLALLAATRIVRDAEPEGEKPRLDGVGSLLSVGGLGLLVFGIVQSPQWGWLHPKDALTIGGTEITPFGFSVVPFLVIAGAVLISFFVLWQERRERLGRDPLVKLELLRIRQLQGGLSSMSLMMFCLAGVFFVLPLYLQIVLGKDPLQTGVQILPLSIAVFFVSLGASRLATRFPPRRIVQVGMALLLAGSVLLLATIEQDLEDAEFMAAMAILGAGLGAIASQLGNVNLSAVGPRDTSEVGGLQGTAQNLGSALGTALIGSILLSGLTAAFDDQVAANPNLPAKVRDGVGQRTSKGIPFVPEAEVSKELTKKGLPQAEVKELSDDYGSAQITALKTALAGVAAASLLGFWFSRRLPSMPMAAPGQSSEQ